MAFCPLVVIVYYWSRRGPSHTLFCCSLLSFSAYLVHPMHTSLTERVFMWCNMLSQSNNGKRRLATISYVQFRPYEPIQPNRSIKYDKPHFFSKQAKNMRVCKQKEKMQPQSIAITSVRVILCHDKYVHVYMWIQLQRRRRRQWVIDILVGSSNILCSHSFFVLISFSICKNDRFSVISRSYKTFCIHLSSINHY